MKKSCASITHYYNGSPLIHLHHHCSILTIMVGHGWEFAIIWCCDDQVTTCTWHYHRTHRMCKTGCNTNRSKCKKKNVLKCTEMCKCVNCRNTESEITNMDDYIIEDSDEMWKYPLVYPLELSFQVRICQ